MGVNFEDRLEDAVGGLILLGVRLVVRLQQQRRDVVRVGEHRRVQRFFHLRRITLGIRLGQAVQQIRVLRINTDRPCECPPGQLEIALGQGQLAGRQQRLAVVGIGLQHPVVKVLLDLLGISRAGLE